jgi:diguanylate cyclase (GGDEF)-like protein
MKLRRRAEKKGAEPAPRRTEVLPRERRGQRQTTQSQPVSPSEDPLEGGSVEANVIVIAHPENKLLGMRYRLTHGSRLEIGRSPSAEISLPEVMSVSRDHARIEYQENSVVLEDLGSTNGTYINDHRIQGPSDLKSGDRFQVGSVHFKFLLEKDVEHAYNEAIFHLVTRDGLTGLANKRKFDEEIEREFARARRYGRTLSLIYLDIDFFKSVNDTHGHLIGDFVLKQVTGRISGLVRPEQVFARIGGEEFAILCPETDKKNAGLLSERLRLAVSSKECRHGDISIPVSCSFGVAELSDGITSPAELCVAADRALYVSKHEGRNRVSIYGNPGD